jgi:hypothetical protein
MRVRMCERGVRCAGAQQFVRERVGMGRWAARLSRGGWVMAVVIWERGC